MSTLRHLSWVAFASVLILGLTAAAQPAPGPADAPAQHACLFTIGLDTTYVSGPVKADGTIDYFAAYNQLRSAGVTPENNAAPLILRVLGAGALPESCRARVLDALKLTDLPAQGLYVSDGAKFGMDQDDYDAFFGWLRRGPWREQERPHVAAWLKANGPAMEILARAVGRSRFWIPVYPRHDTVGLEQPDRTVRQMHVPPGFALPVSALGRLRACANSLGVRAMLRLGRGDAAGSRDDLLTIHRLARLLARDGPMIDNLVATACEAMVFRLDSAWVCDPHVFGSLAKEYLAQLQALGPMPSLRGVVDTPERFETLESVMAVRARKYHDLSDDMRDAAQDLPVNDLDWDQLLRLVNHLYDGMVSVTDKPFAQQGSAWVDVRDQMRGAIDSGGARFEPLKPVAEYILARAGSMFRSASKAREKLTTEFDITLVALAARAFRADKAKWPDDLSDLVPKYLKTLPPDRFAEGQALAGRVEGDAMVIWSVGPNGDGKDTSLRAELRMKPADK